MSPVSILRTLAEALDDVPSDASAPCVVAPEEWTGHSDKASQRRAAARLCYVRQCPILDLCREAAETRGERFGVWGGQDMETAYRRAHDTTYLDRAARRTAAG